MTNPRNWWSRRHPLSAHAGPPSFRSEAPAFILDAGEACQSLSLQDILYGSRPLVPAGCVSARRKDAPRDKAVDNIWQNDYCAS
jgi:hypothetical protein